MTNTERFDAVFNFRKPDRLPVTEWAWWWPLTLERWYSEGLDRTIPPDQLQYHFGLDYIQRVWLPLETKDCPKPPSHGAPIIYTEEDYERIKPALFPVLSDEIPKIRMMKNLVKDHAAGEKVVWVSYDGFFWFARTLLGIENHLYAFYDDPDLIHRINRDLCDYVLKNLPYIFGILKPEFFVWSEDMSYNNGPMLSEDCFNEFILPYYKILNAEIHRYGVKVIIDSDGDITKMIPWLKNGLCDGILPLERQAGVDINKLQEMHPDFIYFGGFDKMTMPKGEEAMRAEFERLLPAMKHGGFIPGCDHQTPPGVPLENYYIYSRLLREYAVKACE